MNYTQLVQAITDYTENNDPTFLANIPTFVRQTEEHVSMTWRSSLAPAREVLPPQFGSYFVDAWRSIVTAIVRAIFDPPPIGSHAVSGSLVSVAVVVVEHVSDMEWIPPFPRPTDLDGIRRHPPALAPRERDARWRTRRGSQPLGGVLSCFSWLCARGGYAWTFGTRCRRDDSRAAA